jgi:hypothetical protein
MKDPEGRELTRGQRGVEWNPSSLYGLDRPALKIGERWLSLTYEPEWNMFHQPPLRAVETGTWHA